MPQQADIIIYLLFIQFIRYLIRVSKYLVLIKSIKPHYFCTQNLKLIKKIRYLCVANL